LIDLRSSHHHHLHFGLIDQDRNKKSKLTLILSLSSAMFLTPCIEIEAYYFQAATIGCMGTFIVSSVYLLITLVIMFTPVYPGLRGASKFNSHYLEHHEKSITGIVLIILGILAYFVEF
jgi:nickel/cobalt transporter (NicO) family protein